MAEELKFIASVAGFDKVDAALKKTSSELSRTAEANNKLDSSLQRSQSTTNKAATAFQNLGKGSQSIFNLTEKLRGLQSAVFTEKDISKIKAYNVEIAATQKQIATLSSVGTSSFGNLGAGATKAFSALRLAAQILPGIGIAGILAFATGPIIEYVSSLFGATEAMKKTQSEADALRKTIGSIFESTGKEAAEVASLIVVLKSETETRQRKLAAMQALAKINPEIFSGLKLEHGAVIGLDKAYQDYLVNLKTVIRAKIIQAQLEQKITELLKLQGAGQTQIEKNLASSAARTLKANANLLQSLGSIEGSDALRNLQKGIDNLNSGKINNLQGDIEGLLKDLGEFSKGIKIDPLKDPKESIKKFKEKFREELKRFTPEKIEVPIEITALGGAFERLLGDLKTPNAATIKIPVTLEPEINTDNLKDLDEAAVVAKIKAAGIAKSIQDGINTSVEGLRFPELTALGTSITDQLDVLTKNMRSTLGDVFSNLGEVLGKSFSEGSSFIKNALGSIFPIMGEFLVQLGKAAIITSKLFLAIKASKVNPISGIIGGIIAIAAGTILKNIKLPQFAHGVSNFGGGVALVGERGAELVTLPRGASVTPAAQTANLFGQQQMAIADVKIAGSDIWLVFNRYAQINNRNT